MTWTREFLDLSEKRVRRALCLLPGAFVLRDERRTFFGALPVETSHRIDPADGFFEPAPGEQESDAACGEIPEWVGVLPYEAFRQHERDRSPDPRAEPHFPSPVWQRYEAVGEFTSGGVEVTTRSGSAAALVRLRAALIAAASRDADRTLPPPTLQWADDPEPGPRHEERIRRALAAIERGSLYQVNLARRFRFRARGHAIALLDSLGSMAEAPYACALDLGRGQVVSTSPEMFLSANAQGQVLTSPIKGTRPRHSDPAKDAELARALEESEKERAELTMVIDIERNDLGRLAVPGSVLLCSPPRVVTHPTVHHREATICAQLRAGVTREQLIVGMMPSGSVTGAPKIAAMDLIRALEAERRGLYTGSLGTISRAGTLRLSMAIRTLTLKDGEGHYFAGGGIVADSDPAEEVEETVWKSEQLRALIKI